MRISFIFLITTLAAHAAVRQHFGLRHINQFTVGSAGKTVAVYGAVKGADTVLLTHHRRDAFGKRGGAVVNSPTKASARTGTSQAGSQRWQWQMCSPSPHPWRGEFRLRDAAVWGTWQTAK